MRSAQAEEPIAHIAPHARDKLAANRVARGKLADGFAMIRCLFCSAHVAAESRHNASLANFTYALTVMVRYSSPVAFRPRILLAQCAH